MTLGHDERSILLELARLAIRDAVRGGNELPGRLEAIEPSAGLQQTRGAFVTLKKRVDGQFHLRGCIGTMEAQGALLETVPRMAVRAARADPRFPPLSTEELDEVRLSVSVLTPMRDIDGPEEIRIGRHGVRLARGTQSAVFLPEVAVQQNWDVSQLLEHLCSKAGLLPGTWRNAYLSVFESESFAES